jgi:hypothetical protein
VRTAETATERLTAAAYFSLRRRAPSEGCSTSRSTPGRARGGVKRSLSRDEHRDDTPILRQASWKKDSKRRNRLSERFLDRVRMGGREARGAGRINERANAKPFAQFVRSRKSGPRRSRPKGVRRFAGGRACVVMRHDTLLYRPTMPRGRRPWGRFLERRQGDDSRKLGLFP